MSEKIYTISVYTENTPGVLHRITTSFTRRKINVESLTVSESEKKGISVFTIVIKCSESFIVTIIKQIKRIIEVIDVYAFEEDNLYSSEVALLKVLCKNLDEKKEIESLVISSEAILTNATENYLVIQIIGTNDKILNLVNKLSKFGIDKFIRSGKIAFGKNLDLALQA